MSRERRIYEEMGVKPMINAAGNQTVLGGSRLSPRVREAMEDANRYFVNMEEMLKRSGEVIAEILGTEGALVTPGCASALALSSAACMAGSDPEKMERLPDTTGMKNEFLIQNRQRYKYDRCLTIFGGQLVEVGDENGTTAEQLEAAIGERTAALHYFATGGGEGVVPFEEAARIGNAHGVPVIVDAASQIYPLDRMCGYTRAGADLVGFGAKYFGSCNSTGILCGRKDLVDAAFDHGFIGFEMGRQRTVGRPLKVDRQEVVAVVVALREWFEMDHEARFAEHERKTRVVQEALEGIPHITVTPVSEARGLNNGVRVALDEAALGKTADQVLEALRQGDPGIWMWGGGNGLSVAVPNLTDEDVQVVVQRLREELGG